jgi:ATP dependent DNA ligase C terminal region
MAALFALRTTFGGRGQLSRGIRGTCDGLTDRLRRLDQFCTLPWLPAPNIKAAFTEPMLLLPAAILPEGANLPEAKSGRWGEGLTAEKMKECRWLKPVLVGQVEFVEWTLDGHLRHSRFVALGEAHARRHLPRSRTALKTTATTIKPACRFPCDICWCSNG